MNWSQTAQQHSGAQDVQSWKIKNRKETWKKKKQQQQNTQQAKKQKKCTKTA